jgi:hypothetical protein
MASRRDWQPGPADHTFPATAPLWRAPMVFCLPGDKPASIGLVEASGRNAVLQLADLGPASRLSVAIQRPTSRAHAGKARIKNRLIAGADPEKWDLPPKPKWMRWPTYNRHVAKLVPCFFSVPISVSLGGGQMSAIQQRLSTASDKRVAVLINAAVNLNVQFCELNRLRALVRKAQLSVRRSQQLDRRKRTRIRFQPGSRLHRR